MSLYAEICSKSARCTSLYTIIHAQSGVDKVADMVADMEVDKAADMEADMFKTKCIKPEIFLNEVYWAESV